MQPSPHLGKLSAEWVGQKCRVAPGGKGCVQVSTLRLLVPTPPHLTVLDFGVSQGMLMAMHSVVTAELGIIPIISLPLERRIPACSLLPWAVHPSFPLNAHTYWLPRTGWWVSLP